MKSRMMILLAGSVLCAAVARAQTTQPTGNDRLDYRASRAFDRGDYAAALPLLRKLSDELADKPAKQAVVVDRIRICLKSLAAAASPPAGPPRIVHTVPAPGQTLDLTIKELGNFDYDQDKGGAVPDDVKRLSGCKIRLKGFMMPIDQSEKITQFALVPSLFGCCYGQPPQIQHVVVVTCPKGMAAELSADEVVIEGTLKVQERKDDGFVVSLFEVSAGSLKLAQP